MFSVLCAQGSRALLQLTTCYALNTNTTFEKYGEKNLTAKIGLQLRQQPGPGPAGSWARPAWFKMLLGLGGNQGGGVGGKEGVILYQFSSKNT